MKNLFLFFIIFQSITLTAQTTAPQEFDLGTISPGRYLNDFFEMEVTFDSTWIVQNKEQMAQLVEVGQELFAGENQQLKTIMKVSEVNTAYLLTVFKYEMGAAVPFNPSFMVIAENLANAPGIKSGNNYLFHTKRALQQSQVKYSFEEKNTEKQIGEHVFYDMTTSFEHLDLTIQQEYISTIINRFGLTIILTYGEEEQRKELYKVIDNLKL